MINSRSDGLSWVMVTSLDVNFAVLKSFTHKVLLNIPHSVIDVSESSFNVVNRSVSSVKRWISKGQDFAPY